MNIPKILNDNQGIISIIGLFIIIPTTILSDRIISCFKGKKQQKELKLILIKELWYNINFIASVNESYINQLNDLNNLHIPHYPPRTHVLEKCFEFDLLNNLIENDKKYIIEIFQLLEDMKYEFYLWKNKLVDCKIIDEQWYMVFSSTLLSYVKPLMSNMLDMWIKLVNQYGGKSDIHQITEINTIISRLISQGKWIRTAYKASEYNRECYININKFDVILCWENDWKECSKEVIEIRNIVALHESWKH